MRLYFRSIVPLLVLVVSFVAVARCEGGLSEADKSVFPMTPPDVNCQERSNHFLVAHNHAKQAETLFAQGAYEEAFEAYLAAAKSYEASDDYGAASATYLSLAEKYRKLDRYAEAEHAATMAALTDRQPSASTHCHG